MTVQTRLLYHPWWAHLPALLALAWLVEVVRRVAERGTPFPLHYGIGGQPDRWGSPWELLIPSLLFIAIAFLVDEVWARQETRKTFNWLSLIDDALVGWMLGITVAAAATPQATFGALQVTALLYAVGALLAALMLELLRPYRPSPQAAWPADTTAAQQQIAAYQQAGERWSYWEQQNPRWFRWVIGITLLVVTVLTAIQLSQGLYWPVLVANLFLALVMLLFYGGFRISVSGDRLEVRLGVLGLRLLRLPLAEITNVEPQRFSPLRDYGGYGIRYNFKTLAFFLSGNTGVFLRTTRRRQYLLGSDQPERLAAVIRAARGEDMAERRT